MRTKIYIATSRSIGQACLDWARKNCPVEFEITDSIHHADIFISVMFDKLLSENFIKSKKKCFNFHPGILPEYRGSGAYSWAILNGENETGVTLHEIDKDIDHGRIIWIRAFPINEDDTAASLFKKAEGAMFSLFRDFFEKIVRGEYESRPQDEDRARTYSRFDLELTRDLTPFARAFHFPGKDPAYYITSRGDRVEIEYEGAKRRTRRKS